MSQHIADKVVEIGRAMGGKTVVRGRYQAALHHDGLIKATHNCGGAVMGDDPKTSVVNRYLQCWDVPNVFSIGASAFPQNGSYNYSVTIGALTYWALDAIKNRYLKAPGPAGAGMTARRLFLRAATAIATINFGLVGPAHAEGEPRKTDVSRGAVIAAQGHRQPAPRPVRCATRSTAAPMAAARFRESPPSRRPILLSSCEPSPRAFAPMP